MSSALALSIVYFRGWFRCVKWKAWSHNEPGFGKIKAVVW